MTTMSAPMCVFCRYYSRAATRSDRSACAAFPQRIPADIFEEYADHRLPYPGDKGIRFEPIHADGAEYVDELYGPMERAKAESR